jgi:hypothetical protein
MKEARIRLDKESVKRKVSGSHFQRFKANQRKILQR